MPKARLLKNCECRRWFSNAFCYRNGKRDNYNDIVRCKTALEIEREFEKDNPPIIIKLLTEDIKVYMTPKLYVLQNTAIYKMKLVVTRGKKQLMSD